MGNVHGSTPLYRTRPMGGWLASHIHLSLGVVTVIAYGTAVISDIEFHIKNSHVPSARPAAHIVSIATVCHPEVATLNNKLVNPNQN